MSAPETDLPKHFFLEAKDYNPFAKKTAPDPSQGNVAGARRRRLAELRLLQENLGKAITNLAVADSQGYMGYAVDVVQGITSDIAERCASLSKAVANAEDRYDEALLKAAAPPEQPKIRYPANVADAVSMRAEALEKDPSLASRSLL